MASATSLEERFNKAVQTIQNLPPNGKFKGLRIDSRDIRLI